MLKENNPELLLCPDMSQWGYFLNIYGRTQQDIDNEFSDLWDTAMRGLISMRWHLMWIRVILLRFR